MSSEELPALDQLLGEAWKRVASKGGSASFPVFLGVQGGFPPTLAGAHLETHGNIGTKHESAGLRGGHMPGAASVPAGSLSRDGKLLPPEALRGIFDKAGIDLEKPIVTSCGSGVTAAILTLVLAESRPVGVVEAGADPVDGVGDRGVVGVRCEVHVAPLSGG